MTSVRVDPEPGRPRDGSEPGEWGAEHARSARRARAFGWWYFARARMVHEAPFLGVHLTTALGNPVLYLVAMGVGLGALVQRQVDGVSYLQFVAPGLVIATVAMNAAGWGMWPVMGGFKWERNYVAASATCLTPGQIALGETVALGLRLAFMATMFVVIGVLFGAWASPGAVLIIPIAVLAGLAFFAPLAAFSATRDDEGNAFNIVNRLVVQPMALLAGTYFPLSTMPWYLQWIGWISPMWHGTQLARTASYGMRDGWATLLHLAVLLTLLGGGLLLARRNFARRLGSTS